MFYLPDYPGKEPFFQTLPITRTCSKKGIFESEHSIEISVDVPDTIELQFDQTQLLEEIHARFEIAPFGRSKHQSLRTVGLKSTRPVGSLDGSIISVQIKGLKELLSDEEEQNATLVLNFTDDTGKTIIGEFSLTTPPATLISEQMRVVDFEKQNVLPKGVTSLRAVNFRLDLLQVIKIENRTLELRELTVPLKIPGKLTRRVDTATLSNGWCQSTYSKKSNEEILSKDIYLLPLDEDLNKRFLMMMNESANENELRISLESETELLLGIYGQGDPVSVLADKGPQKQHFHTEQAVTGCISKCSDYRRKDAAHWDALKTAHGYWKERAWPGMSKLCDDLRPLMNPLNLPENSHIKRDEAALNRCAEWELHNGTDPWDTRRFCQSPIPGNSWGYTPREMWIIQKTTTPVAVGSESHPIYLDIAETSTVKLRRIYQSMPGEARVLRHFFKSRTLQVE